MGNLSADNLLTVGYGELFFTIEPIILLEMVLTLLKVVDVVVEFILKAS